MRGALQDAGGPDMLLSDWRQRHATFDNALKVERNVMFVIVMLIVLVATLNIISGLTMLVKNKGRDIAVLRTMGATRGAIMRVFFISGTCIGLLGTFLGFVLGVTVSIYLDNIRQFLSYITSTPLFPPQVYFLSKLPSELDPTEVSGRGHGFAFALDGGYDLSCASSRAARSCGGFALRMTELQTRICRDAAGIAARIAGADLRSGRPRASGFARRLRRYLRRRGGGAGRPLRLGQVLASAYDGAA